MKHAAVGLLTLSALCLALFAGIPLATGSTIDENALAGTLAALALSTALLAYIWSG